jgi:tellurite resistance protein TerA
LKDGTRGILQPFGKLHGNLNRVPYIELSEDERTGDKSGDDEYLKINGYKWPQIEKILIYTYIYQGGTDWSQIKPELTINLNMDEMEPIKIAPALKTKKMVVCALATLTNVKDGVRVTTHGEYFTSQASMDRAFGLGLKWEDGAKD